MAVGDLRHGPQVYQRQRRVGKHLGVNQPGVGPQSPGNIICVLIIYQRDIYISLFQDLGHDRECLAIDVRVADDMIAGV